MKPLRQQIQQISNVGIFRTHSQWAGAGSRAWSRLTTGSRSASLVRAEQRANTVTTLDTPLQQTRRHSYDHPKLFFSKFLLALAVMLHMPASRDVTPHYF